MTAAGLFAYALLLGVTGARVVAGQRWAVRAPRAALWVWAGLIAALSAAVTLLGVALALDMVPVSANIAQVLRSCVLVLRQRYATPGGAAAAGVGLTLVVGWLARLGWCIARALAANARARARHAQLLAMVGTPDPRLGVVVIAHDHPRIYCLPGRRASIVLSSAARDTLDAQALEAVLAHEHAHLRGRHHLLLAVAAGTSAAFPRIPLLAAAHADVAHLVELVADDAAARRAGRLTLAAALVDVAGAGTPAAALAAAAHGAAARVRRLLQPATVLGHGPRLILTVGVLAAVLAPVALTLAPALLAAHPLVCPFGVPAGTGPCATA